MVLCRSAFSALTTIYLLATVPSTPDGSVPSRISGWATLSGVSAALLAAIQYAPQLLHTYRMKLVGALSIPMMMIQTPGGILMVTSIVLRPGTNWTSTYFSLHHFLLTSYNTSSGWITFAVAALLQGCLLLMCIAWKMRQQKLNVDDFGNPLGPQYPPPSWSTSDSDYHVAHENTLVEDEEPVPGLVTEPSENPIAVRVALATALESAVATDLLTPGTVPSNRHGHTSEQTPLLRARESSSGDRGWSAWFGR